MARPIRLGAIVLALAAIVLVGASWFDRQPASDTAPKVLAASIRSEPTRYNRYVEGTAAGELVSLLVDGRLVRIDRAADSVEPGLAESWTDSPDRGSQGVVQECVQPPGADGLKVVIAHKQDWMCRHCSPSVNPP